VIEAIGSFDQNQESQAIHPRRQPSRDDVQKSQNSDTPPDYRERIRSFIERVTLESGSIRIALARKDNEEVDPNVLTYLMGGAIAPSEARDHPRGERRIVLRAAAADKRSPPSRQSPSESASLAGRAFDGLKADHRIDRRSGKQKRAVGPHDPVADVPIAGPGQSRHRWAPSSRLRSYAADRPSDRLVRSMGGAGSEGAGAHLIAQ
jgi:hypothetical protein